MNKDIEIIKKIEEIFPKRPMKVNKLRGEIELIICSVLLFLLIWLTIENYTSHTDIYHELTTDYKISQNPIKVDGNIRGECKVFTFVTHCSVTISYKNHDIKRTFRFFGSHKISFIGSDKMRDEVSIIASADDPSLVTIDLAIDKLMNRFLLFKSFILIFVMIFFWGFGIVIYRNWSIIKIINQINGQKLKPVLVPIHCTFHKSYGYGVFDRFRVKLFSVSYKIKDSQGKMIKYVTNFTFKSGGPLIISREDYDGEVNATALGIIGETNTTPILLDKQFKRCDFTEQEIQELTNCLSLANKKN